ncbi:PrsW family intramembrane metalloprotease [Ruicaihuangia caeni]|uniref:PrsW family intramembrane metalloprotease n=1 Tax=Ruicaihuangia caeni TaxID=3042517 RepID=UPI00338D8049
MDPAVEPVRSAPFDVRQGANGVAQPVLAQRPQSHPWLIAAGVIGVLIGGVALLIVFSYLAAVFGVAGLMSASLLALVPLVIVVLAVRWIDRWEPEPKLAQLFAFLWGAGVSVLIALLIDSEVQNVIAGIGGDDGRFEFFQATVQAPIVEEVAKGLGVLLVFVFARRHFDGPVDGVVYAALTAAGFAFTENIQYFGVVMVEGDGLADVAATFFMRGFMSPFAHVMFTALAGFAIGFAASKSRSILSGIGGFLVGLVPAVLLHAFWNGALYFVWDFFGYYALVQVPLFLIGVGLVLYLRKQERNVTLARLSEYADAGWFNPAEIVVLATPAGRRRAQTWASGYGLARQMKDYIGYSTKLAFTRQRLLAEGDTKALRQREAMLLRAVVASRRALQAPAYRR